MFHAPLSVLFTCEKTATCGIILLLLLLVSMTMTANKAFLKLSDTAAASIVVSSFEDKKAATSSFMVALAVIIVLATVLAITFLAPATKWLSMRYYEFVDQLTHNHNVATKLLARTLESSTSTTTTSMQHQQEESVGEPLHVSDNIKDEDISYTSETTMLHKENGRQDNDKFVVPPETWGFALDDSEIQRKVLRRILQDMGVPTSRIVVMGKTVADVEMFSNRLLSLIQQQQQHDTTNVSKFLVIVDEILDYSADVETQKITTCSSVSNNCNGIYSGSVTLQKVLHQLTPQQQGHLLALVRSANDTPQDIERYMERGMHGFISKCQQVRVIVAELWHDRFLLNPAHEKQKQEGTEESKEAPSMEETKSDLDPEHEQDDDNDDYLLVSRQELLDSLSLVEHVVQDCCILSINEDNNCWPRLWSALHTLKGDVSMVHGVHDLDVVVELIHGLRGTQPPTDLSSKWNEIQKLVHSGAQCLKTK